MRVPKRPTTIEKSNDTGPCQENIAKKMPLIARAMLNSDSITPGILSDIVLNLVSPGSNCF
jgi:hypothetical protein